MLTSDVWHRRHLKGFSCVAPVHWLLQRHAPCVSTLTSINNALLYRTVHVDFNLTGPLQPSIADRKAQYRHGSQGSRIHVHVPLAIPVLVP